MCFVFIGIVSCNAKGPAWDPAVLSMELLSCENVAAPFNMILPFELSLPILHHVAVSAPSFHCKSALEGRLGHLEPPERSC